MSTNAEIVADSTTTLTLDQKRSFYKDGYIILRNAVSEKLVQTALDRIHAAKRGENIGGEREMTDLINASSITPILTEAMAASTLLPFVKWA